MKLLVAGWFSFEHMGATAGDLLTRDLVCRWLTEGGHVYDVAVAPPFTDGIDWHIADPTRYAAVIFVCGPFGNGPPATEFLDHFKGLRLIGLNLSMLENLDTWNPFDLLIERDSNCASRPDLAMLASSPKVPVAGLVLVHPQKEYGERAMHKVAKEALSRLIDSRELAVVPIDTRLDVNETGLRTPAEVESLISRMDVVLTTRLHGMILALKNQVPPLVIDPIAGGAKVLRQAQTIGWSIAYAADALDDDVLAQGLDYCLTTEARQLAAACVSKAESTLRDVPEQLLGGLQS